jgi:GntR family transcriptional regulator of vanillate catabolism
MNETTQQAIVQTLREKIREALLERSGARVEALMKEHTHISKESLNLSLPALHLIAGAA